MSVGVKVILYKCLMISYSHIKKGNGTNQKNYRAKQTLIEKELVFLELGKKHHLCQGRYKW